MLFWILISTIGDNTFLSPSSCFCFWQSTETFFQYLMILSSITTISCFPQPRGSTTRRVEALYDCQADHHDELSFSEGQVLVVLGQEDSDWWVSIITLHPDWGSHWWGGKWSWRCTCLFMVTYRLSSGVIMQRVWSTYKKYRSVGGGA